MTILHVPLSDEHLDRLRRMAEQAGVSPEELARVSLEQWLTRPRVEFLEAARHVLAKNAELYRRLA